MGRESGGWVVLGAVADVEGGLVGCVGTVQGGGRGWLGRGVSA